MINEPIKIEERIRIEGMVTTLRIKVQRTGAQDIGEVIKRGGTRTKNHIDINHMVTWLVFGTSDQ